MIVIRKGSSCSLKCVQTLKHVFRHLENTEDEEGVCKSTKIPGFPCETRFGSMIIMCRELAGCLTALSQTVVEDFIIEKYGSNEAVQVMLTSSIAAAGFISMQMHVSQADICSASLQEMRRLVLDSDVQVDLRMTLRALNPICDAIYSIEADK